MELQDRMTHLTKLHVKTDMDKIMDKITEIELRDSIKITYLIISNTIDTNNAELTTFVKTLGYE